MRCSACGTENRPGSRFCDQCGGALISACRGCGEPNRTDARFCATCGISLAPEAAMVASSERRLVSVLFVDLVGFTTLAEDRDPEAVRELLSRYFETATEIVRLHGGVVEKFIGDAVMAVWGTPVAHEDDAERAARAALELVSQVPRLHPDLRARAGVLTGEAAVTLGATNQGMVAGDLVNTAARLQGVADPGTVLVGEGTMRAASNAIVFEPIGERSVKGRTSPIPAWRAIRVVAAIGGHGRAESLEPPFVGREEELRQLKETLHAVGRERRPRLVSITGPAGIGKSRLVWELEKYVDGVADKIWWHRGRSPSYGQGTAFWALGEMVRRRAQVTEEADEAVTRQRVEEALDEYVPDQEERGRIGPALLTLLGLEEAPPGGRDALFPAWRRFFERIAERGTTVLVFEDLQWADSGLLDFIDHLLDWSRELPIMVVTLARPELFDRRPDWAVGRRQLTSIALDRLTDVEIRQLLEGLVPGLPADALAAIVGRAEGVPLYAVEMVRTLLADGRIERRDDAYVPTGDLSQLRMPESLISLIAARLDVLGPAARSLLQDAAVLGQVFSVDALAAIGGVTVEELEPRLNDLVRSEVVDRERDPASPEVGRFKFVQSLIREVAYGTLSRHDRRARHLAVARFYETLGEEELAGALANHYVAAHRASEPGAEADAVAVQARLALTAAGERAASLGSPEQALRYLEQAIRLARDPVDRAGLCARAAAAAAAAALDAVPMATSAIEAYEQLGDHTSAIRTRLLLARIEMDASELVQAREAAMRALDDARAMGEPALVAAASATLARAHMRFGNVEEAIVAADEALPIAERLSLEEVVAEALVNKGSALNNSGRRREAAGLLRAALEIAERIGARTLELRIRNNLAVTIFDDDPAGSRKVAEEALELARQIGDRGMHNWMVGNVAAGSLGDTRDWERSLERLDEALEHAPLRGDHLRLLSLRAGFVAARGEGAAELASQVVELAGDSPDAETGYVRDITLATLALGSGDLDTAYHRTMALRQQPLQNPEATAQLALRAAIWARDPDRIRAAAAWVEEGPRSGRHTQAFRCVARAVVAAVAGHRADALAAFAEARESLAELEQRFDVALVGLDAVHLLPDEPDVAVWAEESRSVLESVGARAYLDRLAAEWKPRAAPATRSRRRAVRPAASVRSALGADATAPRP